eukprot:2508298-Ditylum_brightwellii.AAC.1
MEGEGTPSDLDIFLGWLMDLCLFLVSLLREIEPYCWVYFIIAAPFPGQNQVVVLEEQRTKGYAKEHSTR